MREGRCEGRYEGRKNAMLLYLKKRGDEPGIRERKSRWLALRIYMPLNVKKYTHLYALIDKGCGRAAVRVLIMFR